MHSKSIQFNVSEELKNFRLNSAERLPVSYYNLLSVAYGVYLAENSNEDPCEPPANLSNQFMNKGKIDGLRWAWLLPRQKSALPKHTDATKKKYLQELLSELRPLLKNSVYLYMVMNWAKVKEIGNRIAHPTTLSTRSLAFLQPPTWVPHAPDNVPLEAFKLFASKGLRHAL